MATLPGKAILTGPGVQARPLVVPATQVDHAAIANSIEARAREDAERLAAQIVAAAQAQAERVRTDAERQLAQAQVALGRANAEAEQLRAQAKAQLDEVGETIATAAEARRFLEEAKQQAAALIAEAEGHVDALKQAANEQGLEEGRAAGREEGVRLAREELAHELEVAHQMAASLLEARHDLVASAEPAMLRLALDVARTVIAKEVEADPDVLKGTLTRAMLKAAGEERMRLRLHPDDVVRLGTYLDNLATRFSARGVDVVPDPAVGRGGVIVETRSGTVDARMETQVAKIEQSLLSVAGE